MQSVPLKELTRVKTRGEKLSSTAGDHFLVGTYRYTRTVGPGNSGGFRRDAQLTVHGLSRRPDAAAVLDMGTNPPEVRHRTSNRSKRLDQPSGPHFSLQYAPQLPPLARCARLICNSFVPRVNASLCLITPSSWIFVAQHRSRGAEACRNR